MRGTRKVIGIALGVGLTLSTTLPAFAQTPNPQAQARSAIQGFCTWTSQHWAAEGYSSVAEMRNTLGNAQNDWFTTTLQMAGLTGCPTGAPAPSTSSSGTGGAGGASSGNSGTNTGTGTPTGTGTGQGQGAGTGQGQNQGSGTGQGSGQPQGGQSGQ